MRSQHPQGGYSTRLLRKAAHEFLTELGLSGELSVLLVDDKAIRLLNRQWRKKDQPTDVLSFGQKPQAASRKPQAGRTLGDVVISLDTARRQAREGGWPLAAELRRLLAHGILHCLGHDHQRPAEALKMARAERRLLGREGMVGRSLAEPERSRKATAPWPSSLRRARVGRR